MMPRSAILLTSFLLTCATSPAAVVSWGGAAGGNWTIGGNWVGGNAPVAGDDLFFGTPQAGGTKVMNNNFAAGTDFASMQFSSGNYSLSGNRIDLTTGGLSYLAIGGNTTINAPLLIKTVDQAFDVPGTAASITYGGSINTNGLVLTFEGNGTHIVNGNISGTGSVLKREEGVLKLLGTANTPGGDWVIDNGTLEIQGSMGGGDVQVRLVGRLTGNGTVTTNVSVVGDLAPGLGTTLGNLTINGNVTFAGTGSRAARFDLGGGGAADGDQLTVGGNVVLAGANLELNALPAFVPTVGKSLLLINKTGAGAISGTFGGIPEGGLATFDGIRFRFSYVGGNGNDFTATVVPSPPSGITRTWTGNGLTNKWSNPANWSGGVAPLGGDTLRFPAGLGIERQDADCDLSPSVVSLAEIIIEAPGYLLSGTEIVITSKVEAISYGSGTSIVQAPLRLASGQQTFVQTSSSNGLLRLEGGISIDAGTTAVFRRLNAAGNNLLINGVISGDGRVSVAGDSSGGGPTFGGTSPNSYTGGTDLSSGSLRLNKVGAIPGNLSASGGSVTIVTANALADTSVVTLGTGGLLQLNAPETLLDLVMDGGVVQTSSHILTIAGDLQATAPTDPFNVPLPNLLEGNFRLTKSAAEILVEQENDGVQIIGALAGTGANSAAKRGNGQLWLNPAAVASPLALKLEAGRMILIGSTPAGNPVEVSGGRLMGHGQIGAVTAGPGTTRRVLAPESIFETGTFACPSLTLNGFCELQLVPQNITPFVVNGSVNLNTAVLAYIHSGERAVAEGAVLTLISKTTAGPVTGTFNGLPEGARLMGTANHFLISYTGGDGNDVTLTAVRPTNSGTFVWDGEPIRCLCQPDPWVGNITPPPGAVLTFPDSAPPDAASRTITNGVGLLSRGIKYDSLFLAGGGYTFDLAAFAADDLFLMNGLTDDHAIGLNLFKNVLSLDADQEFSVRGTGGLHLQGGVDTNGRTLTARVEKASINPLLTVDLVTGGGIIDKRGPGRMEMSGTAPNLLSSVRCSEGELRLSKPAGINALGGSGAKTLSIGLPIDATATATVTMTKAEQLPDDGLVDIRESGRWEVSLPETVQTVNGTAGELQISSSLTVTEIFPPSFFPSAVTPLKPFRITGGGTLIRTQPRLFHVRSGATLQVATSVRLQVPSGLPAEIIGPGRTSVNGNYHFPDGLSIGTLAGTAEDRRATVELTGDWLTTPIFLNGGTLQGHAKVGIIHGSQFGGRITPSENDEPNVTLFAAGLSLGTGSGPLTVLELRAHPESPTPFKSFHVTTSGTVNLSRAAFELRFSGPTPPTAGQNYKIITKTSPGPVSQPFGGLPEGSVLALGAARFQITYTGGDGNDVVLTSLGMDGFKINTLGLSTPPGGGPGRLVTLAATGLPGASHRLMASDDLQSWTLLATLEANLAGGINASVPDPAASGQRRFYRLEL